MRINVVPYKFERVENIPVGDCFTYNSYVYMKVRDYRCTTDESDVRVVNLHTGEISNFGSKVAVHPVDCIVTNFTEDKKNET